MIVINYGTPLQFIFGYLAEILAVIVTDICSLASPSSSPSLISFSLSVRAVTIITAVGNVLCTFKKFKRTVSYESLVLKVIYIQGFTIVAIFIIHRHFICLSNIIVVNDDTLFLDLWHGNCHLESIFHFVVGTEAGLLPDCRLDVGEVTGVVFCVKNGI